MVVRRMGLRTTFIACQLVLPVVLAARVFAPNLQTHVALSFCAGLVFSIWAVSLSPMTAALVSEERRPRAFSLLFSMGIGLGAVGGVAGSRLPHLLERFNLASGTKPAMRATLLSAIAIAALGLLYSMRLADVRGKPRREATTRALPRGSRLFFVALAGWSFVTGSFSPFAGVYFTKRFGMPLSDFGNVFFLCQTAQVLAVLAAPRLANRLGTGAALLGSQLTVGVCLVVVAVTSRPDISAAAYVVQTAGQWMIEPLIYAGLMTMTPPRLRGAVSAAVTLVIGCSQLAAAGVAGWAFSHAGYMRSLESIAVIAILSGAMFLLGSQSARVSMTARSAVTAEVD